MKIKELLKDEKNWTRGAKAKNSRGIPTNVRSKTACCWCLLGAITKCYEEDYSLVYDKVLDYIEKHSAHFSNGGIGKYNDFVATHEDILKLAEDLDI